MLFRSPATESAVAERSLALLAEQHGLAFKSVSAAAPPCDGLPDLVLKTTPDRVVNLAREIANQFACRTVALCYSGVVHIHADKPDGEQLRSIVARYESQLREYGGDWQSRHLGSDEPSERELLWISQLEQAMRTV